MTYQVGSWQFHPETNSLSADGETIALENRTARVLEHFCQNPGRAISREELMDRVWGRSALSDHSVAIVISDLRKALGDSASEGAIIKTIPKRGYVFNPPAEEQSSEKSLWKYGWACGLGAGLIIAIALYLGVFSNAQQTLVFHDLRSLNNVERSTFLAESLTEILLAELSRVQDLRVVRIRGDADPLAAGSIPLNRFVRNDDLVLSGSISPAGEGLLLTLRLESGKQKQVLWGYSEELTEDYYFVSGRHAARSLNSQMGWQQSEVTGIGNERAERLFWRSIYLWESREAYDTKASHQSLLQALDLQPDFARAHAQLAIMYAHKTGPYLGFESPSLFELAEEQLQLAREDGAEIPEVHVSRALIDFYRDRNYRAALESLDRGLERWQSNALLWHTRGMVASAMGLHEESLYSIEKARALDPLSRSINWDRVWFLYLAGRFKEAVQAAEEAEQLTGVVRHTYLALIHEALGDRAEAFNSWLRMLEETGMSVPIAEIRPGDNVDYPRKYRSLLHEVERQGEPFYPDTVKVFWAHLAEDEESTLSLLEAMPVVRENWVYYWLPEIPALSDLRDNERFRALIGTFQHNQGDRT